MDDQGYFSGVAIVIDDELDGHPDNGNSEIAQIVDAIRKSGGQVVTHSALPPEDFQYVNYAGASFFILDWQLDRVTVEDGGGEAVPLPAGLKQEQLDQKVAFLKKIKLHRFAPVFIFTREDVASVENALRKHRDLYEQGEEPYIFVKSKDDVIREGVYTVLNDWLQKNPSALTLKLWEQTYETARNQLFVDFYNRSVLWPVVLWHNFQEDGLPASDELGRLISRNLLSRMVPFHIDMKPFEDALSKIEKNDPAEYKKILLRVFEGERFVRNEQLHEDSIAPGDIFKEERCFYINIRPDCDCVDRLGQGIDLYLLKGKKISAGDTNKMLKAGRLSERDDEAAVFAMIDGSTFIFKLQELHQKKWSDLKAKRIGRLLSPFLTRIQQRYASYLQRPGLPKIPAVFMPPEAPATTPAGATGEGSVSEMQEAAALPSDAGAAPQPDAPAAQAPLVDGPPAGGQATI